MQIETRILIDANPEKVWSVLTDAPSYPEWNPLIRELNGELKTGGRINVKLQLDGQKPMHFSPIVLLLNPQKEFRWKGKFFVKGLFDGEHFFRLEQADQDKTLLIHGEHFTGILMPILMLLIKGKTRSGFEKMNKNLKSRCEEREAGKL